MANNRMALVCVKCGEGMAIAKYYPSTGWYPTSAHDDARLENWMEEHRRKCGTTHLRDGSGDYRLAYESDGMTDWHYAGDPENAWSERVKERDRLGRILEDTLRKEV